MRKINFRFLFIMTLLIVMSCEKDEDTSTKSQVDQQEEATLSSKAAWSRVFTDNFNGNLNKWEKTTRKDYNSSICNYVSSNPRIGNLDGKSSLLLRAYKSGNEYTSGHVKSFFSFKPKRNEQYRVSASIKLIARQGSAYKGFGQTYGAWPAFWTAEENGWPTKGEIDIVERYSFAGNSRSASNLFYGTQPNVNLLGTSAERGFEDNEGWHQYDMYWTNVNGNVYVDVFVDNKQVANYHNGINGNLRLENFGPHNIIILLNVGSNSNVGIFDNSRINLFSHTDMYVDYVFVDRKNL